MQKDFNKSDLTTFLHKKINDYDPQAFLHQYHLLTLIRQNETTRQKNKSLR